VVHQGLQPVDGLGQAAEAVLGEDQVGAKGEQLLGIDQDVLLVAEVEGVHAGQGFGHVAGLGMAADSVLQVLAVVLEGGQAQGVRLAVDGGADLAGERVLGDEFGLGWLGGRPRAGRPGPGSSRPTGRRRTRPDRRGCARGYPSGLCWGGWS
jgi:hypothetical protein